VATERRQKTNRNFEHQVKETLRAIAETLGYDCADEYGPDPLHWVDHVWFETRLPSEFTEISAPGLPTIGFEIEGSDNLQSIKAAIVNLEALRPALGIIVLPEELAKKRMKEHGKIWPTFRDRVKHLGRRAACRVSVVTERELRALHQGLVAKPK